jgi:hypothetical protein
MLAHDLHNKVTVTHVLDAAAYNSTTTKTSWIDTKGLSSVEFVVNVGVSAAAVAVTMYEHDTTADTGATAVASTEYLGTFTAVTGNTDDQVTIRQGYLGTKRYVGLNIVTSGNAILSCDAICGIADREPVPANTLVART